VQATVARNKEGEFELALGNKQLLSVFMLVILLLAVCFVGGFLLGRTSAAIANAANKSSDDDTELLTALKKPAEAVAAEEYPELAALPGETRQQTIDRLRAKLSKAIPEPPAPQATVEAKAPEPPKPVAPPPPAPKAAPKQEPVKAEVKKPEPTKPAGSTIGQPVPGRVYLQLSATDRAKADVIVDLLRKASLPGFASPVKEKAGIYRVLVGPIADNGVDAMKSRLKSGGFPADQAIRRIF
jgi:outer membrane biosynthesis protein TonB